GEQELVVVPVDEGKARDGPVHRGRDERAGETYKPGGASRRLGHDAGHSTINPEPALAADRGRVAPSKWGRIYRRRRRSATAHAPPLNHLRRPRARRARWTGRQGRAMGLPGQLRPIPPGLSQDLGISPAGSALPRLGERERPLLLLPDPERPADSGL